MKKRRHHNNDGRTQIRRGQLAKQAKTLERRLLFHLYLGQFEFLVLLALIRLREEAYGMTIRREIAERTAREVSIGAVYATLDRLAWRPRNEGSKRREQSVILRHLFARDYEPERLGAIFPTFHGFVHHTGPLDRRDELAKDKEVWTYVNLIEIPPPEWFDAQGKSGNPVLDWMYRAAPRLTVGDKPVVGWGGRELIDWRDMDQQKLHEFYRRVMEHIGKTPAFFDQFWTWPRPWMLPAVYQEFDPASWEYWRRRILRFRRMFLAGTLCNGDRSAPSPLYLEHAERSWEQDRKLWMSNPANVLSVDARAWDYVIRLDQIEEANHDRRVAMTTGGDDESVVDKAYEYLTR